MYEITKKVLLRERTFDDDPKCLHQHKRLGCIDNGSLQFTWTGAQAVERAATEVRTDQFGTRHLDILQVAAHKAHTGKIRSLEVGIAQIAVFKAHSLECGETKLG